MINFDRMQRQFEESKHYSCGESQADRLANWNVWKDAWKAGLASQAQQPTDLSKQLREYAVDSGYSHNDYADTMLAAASEIERLTASQAQQPTAYRVIASANGEVVRDSLEFTRMSDIDEKVVSKSYDLEIVPLYAAMQSQAQQKCSCVRATARNTPAVKAGYEMGGYVKNVCAYCQSKAQQYHSEDALNMVQSQAQQSQWISVEERLPEIDTPVLAVVGKNIYALARVEYDEGWLWGIGCNDLSDARNYEADDDYQPTHWMPLAIPPAPEGE